MANNPHSQLRSSFTWDRKAKQIEPLPTTPNKQQIMPQAKKKNKKTERKEKIEEMKKTETRKNNWKTNQSRTH